MTDLGQSVDPAKLTPVDREHLDALVGEGWLRCQRHPEADLWIYNYTPQTQYDNHWTPETLMCRGLILDAAGAIVARPFAKFFNYGTPQATIPNEPFVITEKMDGSLGILYWLDGEPCIATRGSFISEQAVEGTRMIRDCEIAHTPGVTPLFEVIYPSNRIVVDYGARRDLVLLAAIRHEDGRDAPLPAYTGTVVQTHDGDDLDALAAIEDANREGFVVAFESGHRVKIKLAEYVRLHKLISGISARMIWESLRDGGSLDAVLGAAPDELHAWITATRDEIQASYDHEEALAKTAFALRPDTVDRKTLAQFFLSCVEMNSAVLFRMLDGNPYDDLIWKAVRPGVAVPDLVTRLDG